MFSILYREEGVHLALTFASGAFPEVREKEEMLVEPLIALIRRLCAVFSVLIKRDGINFITSSASSVIGVPTQTCKHQKKKALYPLTAIGRSIGFDRN